MRCRVDVPRQLTARVDPDRIRQAVDNLLDNALCYAPPKSEIILRARRTSRNLTIEVIDSGPGFPPEFLPRAFERFGRPDSGRARSDGGAGLGLAIVNAIALAHAGRATARNCDKTGAAVTIELPDTT